jgi:branched-chain amino acid transport system permease protein
MTSAAQVLAVSPEVNGIVVGGLALGGLYALLAVGFTVVFKATRAVNFAQGSFAAVGAYLYSTLSTRLHFGQVAAFAVTVVACAAIGMIVYWFLLRRMAGAEEFVVIIATLGLSLVVASVLMSVYGVNTSYIQFGSDHVYRIAGFHFTALQLAAFVISAAAIAIIGVASIRTRWGVAMKAVAEDPLLAGLYGTNVDLIGAGAWALGVTLSGAAGIVYAAQTGLSSAVSAIGLVAFPAIIFGGLDSIVGAIVGGLVIGYLMTVVTTESSPTTANLVGYGVLLLFVLVRPQGLFGVRAGRRV